jgi:ABC-type branched-subunit amino acid transport system substrate-binding protein
VKWAFTTIPPPRFEVVTRLDYIQKKTQIKKIGVLHDPSPYANAQKAAAEKEAKDFGLEIVGIEQYKTDDADLSVQIQKMYAAGARAIIKIGLGGTTLTAAKNIKQLGLDMIMLTSLEDIAVFRPVAEVLGDKFFFVASPAQVYDALPDSALKKEIGKFLEPWRAKYQDRDPNWAGRGWDAMMLVAAAVEKAKSTDGAKLRDTLETMDGFQGTTGVYHFSASNHQGITENPLLLATIINGEVKVVK